MNKADNRSGWYRSYGLGESAVRPENPVFDGSELGDKCRQSGKPVA